MMRAKYTTRNGRLTIEIEAPALKDLFKDLGMVAEVFDSETECGMCGKDHIRFVHRTSKGFDFYELRCDSCGARFQFGQKKEGGNDLFPKRRDSNGNNLPDGGWSRYEGGDSNSGGQSTQRETRPNNRSESRPSQDQEWLDDQAAFADAVAAAGYSVGDVFDQLDAMGENHPKTWSRKGRQSFIAGQIKSGKFPRADGTY